MTRRGWRGLAAVALPLAAVALQAPTLSVDPATPEPGGPITVTGEGFTACVVPNSGDGAVVDQDVVLTSRLGIPDGTLLVGGTFSAGATLAPDAAPGTYTITARCRSRVDGVRDPSASIDVEVRAADVVVVPTGPTDVVGPVGPTGVVVPPTVTDGPDGTVLGTGARPVTVATVAAVVGAVALVALLAMGGRELRRRRPGPGGHAPSVRVRVHRGVSVRPTVEHGSGRGSGVHVVPRPDPGHRSGTGRRSRT